MALPVVIPPYHFAAAHLGKPCSWWLFWICRWLSHLIILQQRTWARIVQLVAVVDLQVVVLPYQLLWICRCFSHLIILQQRTWARSAAGGCCDSAGGYPTFSFCGSAHWQLAGARLLLHACLWAASAVARLGLCRPAGGLDEQL